MARGGRRAGAKARPPLDDEPKAPKVPKEPRFGLPHAKANQSDADGKTRCIRCRYHIFDGPRKELEGRGPFCLLCYVQLLQGLERVVAKGDSYYQKRYGIGLAEYGSMYVTQGGVCAICADRGTKREEATRTLAVDHDHATGDVRGLLCSRCNTALGLMADNPGWLRTAAEYIEAPPGY